MVAVGPRHELGVASSEPLERKRGALSERALVKRARRGDPDATEELVRRHWHAAHHAAYLITRDPSAAEDVAQESILSALDSLRSFDGRRPFRPWLHRIVVNRSIDWLRASERRGEVALGHEGPTELEVTASDGPIGPALASLDPQTRAIVVLRCLFDYRAKEVAEMLGTTPGAVRTRLHRGLGELRDRLEEEVR